VATTEQKLDWIDRRFILSLNDMAACYAKLVHVTTFPIRDHYVFDLGRYVAYTDAAVEAAMRRVA